MSKLLAPKQSIIYLYSTVALVAKYVTTKRVNSIFQRIHIKRRQALKPCSAQAHVDICSMLTFCIALKQSFQKMLCSHFNHKYGFSCMSGI